MKSWIEGGSLYDLCMFDSSAGRGRSVVGIRLGTSMPTSCSSEQSLSASVRAVGGVNGLPSSARRGRRYFFHMNARLTMIMITRQAILAIVSGVQVFGDAD
jgi:hypothetical protein